MLGSDRAQVRLKLTNHKTWLLQRLPAEDSFAVGKSALTCKRQRYFIALPCRSHTGSQQQGRNRQRTNMRPNRSNCTSSRPGTGIPKRRVTPSPVINEASKRDRKRARQPHSAPTPPLQLHRSENIRSRMSTPRPRSSNLDDLLSISPG